MWGKQTDDVILFTFNRTTVECKSASTAEMANGKVAFNRTTVECKWGFFLPLLYSEYCL